MARKKTTIKRAPEQPTRVDWMLFDPDDAIEAIIDTIVSLRETESVALADSLDRVLAKAVKATFNMPGEDRSQRDGFAVRSEDTLSAPVQLSQVSTAMAGHPSASRLKAGQCIRIATGAVMPKGADSVVMFEDVEAIDGGIRVSKPVAPGAWVAHKGSDFAKGQVVLEAGTVMSPPKIAAAAAMGISDVTVLRKPRVLVYTTGDEIQKPGEKLLPGQVYDGNTAALCALLRQNGAEPVARKPVKDTLAAQTAALRAGAEKYDAIMFTGGTSIGDRDFGRRALDAVGKTVVHGVNLKPGKPLLYGTIGKTPVFGLPGFPVSATILAYIFVVPAIQCLAGYPQPYEAQEEMPLGAEMRADPHKMFVVPVSINDDGEVLPTFRGSAEISSISRADGYVILPPGDELYPPGAVAPVRLI